MASPRGQQQDFLYDVYISHAREDIEWCRMLANRLREQQFKVWFDEWELSQAKNISSAINDGLNSSRKILLVMTPAYFHKEWTQAELNYALFADPSGNQRILIPILLKDSELPPLLRTRQFIDFRDDSQFEKSFRALVKALREKDDEAFSTSQSNKPSRPRKRTIKAIEHSEKAPQSEKPSQQTTTPESRDKFILPVATHLHSDKWTLDDQLGYSLYAKAMAEFIRHKQTDPPLTIGILAPWGQGKTTLMRMLEDQIQPSKKSLKADATKPPRSKFREFMKWLDNPNLIAPEKLSFPTIWFNAWKFQNSEQVWAGMAHCIISELVEQLPTQVDRERFWLALQAERLDFSAIRRDIHRAVFEKVLPTMVRWLLGLVFIASALLVIASVAWGNMLGLWGGVSLSLFASLNRLWVWWKSKKELFDKPLEGKFAQYVQQPDYEGKMGYFSQVETDVRRVFDLLVKKEEPAIVFVDDLDRCSPGKVAEVIEAINLFLSGDFPNCYFVIGMDAQVVAASLEVAYEKLNAKLEHTTQSYGSLGWYFMDKFIQLPFLIPSLNEEQRKKYLAKLFRQSLEEEKASPEEVAAAEQRINAALSKREFSASQLVAEVAKESPKILHADPRKFRAIQERIIAASAEKFSDDDPEIQNQLLRYAPYLGNTPRTVKRFANLYRFYRFSQWSRQLQGFESASPNALGRWLVLMLRWPQLVRWIQWEGEAPSLNARDALSKAEAFEKLVDDAKAFEDWNEALKKTIDKLKLERAPQLYELLRERQDESERIVNALRVGVW